MRRRLRAATVALIAALTAGIAAGPAEAYYEKFWFVKNTNNNSTLWYKRYESSTGKVVSQPSWRAGSGVNTNACHTDHGWLPNGWYDVQGHWNHYAASRISGRVWWLTNKACGSYPYTLRTDLFIHTEETPQNTQDTSLERWWWDGTTDFYSEGCIKMRPNEIGALHTYWSNWDGHQETFTMRDGLRVY
jgi:hypothetical protein